jgi:putative transposase
VAQQTYKYRLYPTAEQQEKMEGWLEKLRWLYNTALVERRNNWRYRGRLVHGHEQRTNLPALKERSPQFKEVHSQVLQNTLVRLDRAFENFFRRVREGAKKPGYPRLKSRGRYRSFTYPQAAAFRILESGNKIRLSGIGNMKLRYHRQMVGTPKAATVVRYPSGKWYVCISCETFNPPVNDTAQLTGFDLGLTNYLTSSDGTVMEPLRAMRKAEKQTKRQSRKLSRKAKGSKKREKQRIKRARVHERVANRRRDFLHKVSRHVVAAHDGFAFEKLRVKNMLKNHLLAKAIADAGWATFLDMVAYKAERAGKPFVLVDPRGTTQECSGCGTTVRKELAQRTHQCFGCGLTLSRDHNSAIVVETRAGTVRSNARGEAATTDGRHPRRQADSPKREASSSQSR